MRTQDTIAAPDKRPERLRTGLRERPSRTRSVAWGLGYTTVATVLQFVQGIVLVPLFLRFIDIQLYGAWLATGNVIAMLALLDPGVGDIIRLRASQAVGAGDRVQAGRTIGTGLVLISAVLAAVAAAGLAAIPLLPRILPIDPRNWPALQQAIVIALAGTGLTLLGYSLGNVLETVQRQRELAFATLSSMVLGIVATVWFLVHASLGVTAIALGAVVRGAFQVLVLAPLCARALRCEGITRVKWSSEEARAIRGIGFATFTARVMSTTAQQADSLLTAVLLGPTATVALSVVSKPRDILQSFPSRLNYTAAPAIAHRVGEDSAGSAFARDTSRIVLRVVALSIALATILMTSYVALSRDFIGLWVGDNVFGGQALVILLGISGIVVTAKESLGYAASAYGRLASLARLSTIEVVLRLGSVLGLVWAVGLVGVPIGVLVASSIVLVPTAVVLSRSAGIERQSLSGLLIRLGAAALALVAGAAVVATWGPRARSWLRFAVHGAFVVAVFTCVLLLVSTDARCAFRLAADRFLEAVGQRSRKGPRGAP